MTSANPSGTWTSAFPGTLAGVAGAARWLDDVSAAAGFPEDLVFGIQICVEELLTNTVRHGGGHWPGGATTAPSPAPETELRMVISVHCAPDVVTVVLEDDGRPFDVAAAIPHKAEKPLETARPGGLGIQLIRQFSHDLSYDHVGGMNRTTLKFLWPQAALSLL